MSATAIASIKRKPRGMVEVSTLYPHKTFTCEKSALDNPFTFAKAMLKHVKGRPSGPLWGHGRYLPQTKGEERAMWEALKDAAE